MRPYAACQEDPLLRVGLRRAVMRLVNRYFSDRSLGSRNDRSWASGREDGRITTDKPKDNHLTQITVSVWGFSVVRRSKLPELSLIFHRAPNALEHSKGPANLLVIPYREIASAH